ncbi:MFS transporter [Acinetobacter guillouiae]|uniref:MFS transporter n=1 Tax=Acinetobacter guillouiae TaxID=106649 RepID=UPI0028E9CCE5|nr:MFS transporter [Acinetobacter guillouiae]
MNKNNDIWMMATLLNGISLSMILPLLAPLIRLLKISELQAGLMVSASALLMSLTAMWISKKPNLQNHYYLLSIGFIGMSITWGLFSGVLSYGLMYSLPIGLLFTLLLLTRSSIGFFMAMPQIALQSYVMTRYLDETTRSQKMASFGALNSAGLILGPFLTTLLIIWGILIPLWLAVLLLTVMSMLIVCLYQHKGENAQQSHSKSHAPNHSALTYHFDEDQHIQDPLLQKEISQQDSNHSQLVRLSDDDLRKSMIWLILGFSLYIAIITLNLTAGFYIQDKFQFNIQQSALYFSQCLLIVGIVSVLMQIAISKWLNWSLTQLLMVGLSSMLIGLILSIYTQQIVIFQLAYVFYGIAVACLMPAFTTGASQSVSINLQTKIAALCTMAQALSLVVAPLMSTGLYQLNIIFPYYLLLSIFLLLSFYFVVFKWNK